MTERNDAGAPAAERHAQAPGARSEAMSGLLEAAMRSALEELRSDFPPAGAKPADGRFRFRLVRSDPPTAADFVPHCLEPGFDRQRFLDLDAPSAVRGYTGVSVLNTHARASKLRKAIPALRSRLVATGPIAGGLTRNQSSGHLVWWPQPSITWFWETDRAHLASSFVVVGRNHQTTDPAGSSQESETSGLR